MTEPPVDPVAALGDLAQATERALANALVELFGFTNKEAAAALGYSSPEYFRKVRSGAKPGRLLRDPMTELLTRGRVRQAVPRRRAATGELARVRGRAGEPSRAPVEAPPVRPMRRGTFAEQLTRTDAGTRHLYELEVPRTEGVRREAGREALMAQLRAHTGEARVSPVLRAPEEWRVRFRVTFANRRGERSEVTLGGKGGYRVADVLQRAQGEGDDPLAVLADDSEGSRYGIPAGAAIVAVVAEFY